MSGLKLALQIDIEERLFSPPTPVETSKVIIAGSKVPVNTLLAQYAANELKFYEICTSEEVFGVILLSIWSSAGLYNIVTHFVLLLIGVCFCVEERLMSQLQKFPSFIACQSCS